MAVAPPPAGTSPSIPDSCQKAAKCRRTVHLHRQPIRFAKRNFASTALLQERASVLPPIPMPARAWAPYAPR